MRGTAQSTLSSQTSDISIFNRLGTRNFVMVAAGLRPHSVTIHHDNKLYCHRKKEFGVTWQTDRQTDWWTDWLWGVRWAVPRPAVCSVLAWPAVSVDRHVATPGRPPPRHAHVEIKRHLNCSLTSHQQRPSALTSPPLHYSGPSCTKHIHCNIVNCKSLQIFPICNHKKEP